MTLLMMLERVSCLSVLTLQSDSCLPRPVVAAKTKLFIASIRHPQSAQNAECLSLYGFALDGSHRASLKAAVT